MKKIEHRLNIAHDIRAEEGERRVKGYAAVFNQSTRIGSFFDEKIAPGAFGQSIRENDVRALWSHNTDLVIGRNKNSSLTLREDGHGLGFELSLPDTSWGRDAYELIKGNYVDGVSFGFRVNKESWEKGKDGKLPMRTLEEIDLIEISPTAFPAYEQTNVSARSAEELLKEQEKAWAHVEHERQQGPTLAELRGKLDHIVLHMRIEDLS